MNTSQRYQRLLARRAPQDDRALHKFAEAFETQPGESTRYILGAMRPVEAKYTARLKEQGDRVQNQLEKRIENHFGLAFRRQGSVSNNTHIKFYSDVDVLAIVGKFETLERPQLPAVPYHGDPIDDLTVLRADCARELRAAFPAATVDNSGAKAICLSGGSLACAVDVVPSNWFNTNAYAASGAEHDRGIQVLDNETRERVRNFPFLYNHRIEHHDVARFGKPRMLMRLLKTIRADAEDDGEVVGCSSYDLCSLVYRMPDSYFTVSANRPLDIVGKVLEWLRVSMANNEGRSALKVVDDSRPIFQDGSTVAGVKLVHDELKSTYEEAKAERGGLALLTEAHIR